MIFSGLELNSVEQWPSRTEVAHLCYALHRFVIDDKICSI